MAYNGRNLFNLVNQASTELGGDPTELGPCFPWDRQDQRHQHIQRGLGNRVSLRTPLRLISEKKLTETDVRRSQNRLIISRHQGEESIFRCLTLNQRLGVHKGDVVPVVGHDQWGRMWDLKFRLRKQESTGSMYYVLIGQWAEMVANNGWMAGDQFSIWGFPYAGVRDGWEFGPDQGYDEVHFLLAVNGFS